MVLKWFNIFSCLTVREISPKYVFGEKKYGRRTKPRDDSFILNQSNISQDLNSSLPLSPRKLEYVNVSFLFILLFNILEILIIF